MDNKQGKNIDDLFRQKLGQMEVTPDPQAWEKLAGRLEEGKKPLGWFFGKLAAGLAIIFGLGAVWYQFSDSNGVEEYIVQYEDIPNLNENLVLPPTEELEAEEKEENTVQETLKTESPEPKGSAPKKDKSRPPLAAIGEEAKTSRVEAPVITLPPIELVDVDFGDLLVEELISPEPLPKESEVEYKVRIVSRGYAFAPDKGDLVDGIENQVEKIGNFFSKVDQGFSELQDAKNDFFAFKTTKREKQQN
ncbi:hypothetical protein [Pleomorphovibrio marinus]|uniref:hypothetical protein n=1 Tax=Pleomorphovibrio marinus TaxID=2164132 RepID=UPI000E0BC961|nr:hypothetical protein [Pleomorphovibrio marinus]